MKSVDFVQIIVIKLFMNRRKSRTDICVINKPPHLAINFSANGNLTAKAVTVESAALMTGWYIRQQVGSFKSKFLYEFDFHFSLYVKNRWRKAAEKNLRGQNCT